MKQGDLLFTIDKRPFQTALDQARANLAQARPTWPSPKAISSAPRSSCATRPSPSRPSTSARRPSASPKPSVAAQEAAVRQAELDLEFTELRRRSTGRIGDRRVSPGNLVTGGTGGTPRCLRPSCRSIRSGFEFTFDEASYLRYERVAAGVGARRSKKDDIAARGGSTVVRLKLIDEPDFTHVGHMDFVDNVIERGTGTIRGRAVFANQTGLLTPGMFARVAGAGFARPTRRC